MMLLKSRKIKYKKANILNHQNILNRKSYLLCILVIADYNIVIVLFRIKAIQYSCKVKERF